MPNSTDPTSIRLETLEAEVRELCSTLTFEETVARARQAQARLETLERRLDHHVQEWCERLENRLGVVR